MPLTLHNLTKARATVIVDFQGEQVKVVYNPVVITQEYLDTRENNSSGIYEALSDMVIEWDIQEEEGGPLLGTDFESVKKVPLAVAWAIFAEIMDALRDGSAGKASSTTFNSTEQQGSFPTGLS